MWNNTEFVGLSWGATEEYGLDCVSSNFEFSEEMAEWTNFLKRMKKVQSWPHVPGEETRPINPREEARTPYTLLATFPHSGTSFIQNELAALTKTCLYYQIPLADVPNLQMSINREMYVNENCLSKKAMTSMSVALIKSHLRIEQLLKHCQGWSYSHDWLFFSSREDWETFLFDFDITIWNITKGYAKIVHLIRNPWDNAMSRLARMLSHFCYGSDLCEGFVHLNKSWDIDGTTELVWVSKQKELAALRLHIINDFIGWLTFHHQLALRIRRSRIPFLTVMYSDLIKKPLEKILEIANFVGYQKSDMNISAWSKPDIWNLGDVCEDGRMVPVKLSVIPKEIRQEITSRLGAYLDGDARWMEPSRDEHEVFPQFFRKCLGQPVGDH